MEEKKEFDKEEMMEEELTEESAEATTEALEEAEEEKEQTESAPEEKKGFFKKKEKKDKKDEQIAELTDKVKRQLAEFENFRNRTEKEKSQMYMVGAKDVIEKLLPVVDSFERGIKSIKEEEKDNPVASGMEMVFKQLMSALTELGVTPIEAIGKEFDPNFHNAVMHVDDEELGENIIVEELQKGYQYKDVVLRYSMVKVAN